MNSKRICNSVHLGKTKIGTQVIIGSKLRAVQVRWLAVTGEWCESSKQHRTVGNESPCTASNNTSLLPKSTGFGLFFFLRTLKRFIKSDMMWNWDDTKLFF